MTSNVLSALVLKKENLWVKIYTAGSRHTTASLSVPGRLLLATARAQTSKPSVGCHTVKTIMLADDITVENSASQTQHEELYTAKDPKETVCVYSLA